MSQKFASRQEVFTPIDLGLNALAMNSARTSNWIGCEGFNQLTLEFDCVRVAGTFLTWFIDVSRDLSSVKNARRLQIVTASAAGVDTLMDHQWSIDLTAGSKKFALDIPLNYYNVRIASLTWTTAGATDTLSLGATLGVG